MMTVTPPRPHMHVRLVGLALALACASAVMNPASAAPLPGGAGTLSESYQDWQINCATKDTSTHCTMVQMQADPKTRQRVLAMEIGRSSDGRFSAMLVLPFGLALAKGVSLRIDDGDEGNALGFTTCLPAGCLVPFAIDDVRQNALKAGATLNISATASDSAQPVAFGISLNGFSSAFARLVALDQ